MRQVDIIGIGLTAFGRQPERSPSDLGSTAALEAIKDSGIKPTQVGAGFYGNALGARLFGESTAGQNVLWQVGISRVPVVNVENACTSSSSAFYLAWCGVAAGLYDTAIVVGAEKMLVPGLGLVISSETQLECLEGLVTPAGFALRAKRHKELYGTTDEQIAMVAVKNRRHACLNPRAQFRDAITIEEVLNSPMISDPLTRLSCCPNADGAAAVVLCASEISRRYTSTPIRVSASVLVTGSYENPAKLVPWETDYRGCRTAYEQSGLGPEDLSAVECHDAFTIAEILHYEALGLCAEGEGGQLVESGATSLGGCIPVNPSGGLLSKGHPVGATGVAQIAEGVMQLRGQAGRYQVEGAKVFLAHCAGGDKDADLKSCTVHILQI